MMALAPIELVVRAVSGSLYAPQLTSPDSDFC